MIKDYACIAVTLLFMPHAITTCNMHVLIKQHSMHDHMDHL